MSKTTFTLAATALALSATVALAQQPTPLVTQPPGRLLAVLQSPASQKEKADACRELAVVGTKDAVPALVALLADEQLAHMARYALETLPDPSIDTALRQTLPRLRGRPLVGVIGTLGVRHDVRAVEPLAELLANEDAEVAQGAARALGTIATPEAGKLLQRAFAKVTPQNQLAFCEALFRCAESWLAKGQRKEAIALYTTLRRQTALPHQVRAGALRGEILARGVGDLALLREGVASKDYILFAAAVRAGLELPGAPVTAALTAALPALPVDNRVVVIKALGQRHDAAAVPALTTCAQGGDKAPRLAALQALAAIGGPKVVPVLLGVSGDPDRELAQVAKESLASLPGNEVDQAVVAKLASQNAAERLVGLELIGRRRLSSALPQVFTAAGDADTQVRAGALKRLGELAGTAELP
jgi:HEAT repeat protein